MPANEISASNLYNNTVRALYLFLAMMLAYSKIMQVHYQWISTTVSRHCILASIALPLRHVTSIALAAGMSGVV